MKPSDYVDIGQYLRESRESLNISLESAAHALNIRGKYLLALESGDMKDMPGKAYIRGYIRTYARFLNLNEAEVLEAYGALLQPKGHELFIPEQTMHHNTPSRNLILLSLAGLAVLYLCWYFGVHDRTQLDETVDMPDFAQLLDKNKPPVMDKAWEDCLNNGTIDCFLTLKLQEATSSNVFIYHDIKPPAIPPYK